MPSRRIKQVNELIRHELAEIINKEIEFPESCLITIEKVETSGDLEKVKIWISVLPIEYRGKVLNLLKKNIYHLQKILDNKLVMKFVPKIHFCLDRSEEEAERVNVLLDKIKKER